MKIFYAVFLFLFTAVSIFGQAPVPSAPEQISYQAVVRDATNAIVANKLVGMRISVLQATADGTAVYVETQTPTTNANGLLSIYIGAGTPFGSGVFSNIVWSTGPYFIKIEIDPSGDTANYTITGTTQLVSVPFALYAKTAGNDVLKENTANKSTDVAIDAASDVKFPSVKSVKTYVDIVQADVAANETASTTSDATLQRYIDALENKVRALGEHTPIATVGDLRAGGVVFWVDPADNTHGLVCAIRDLSPRIRWYNGTNTTTGATGSAIGTGSANTTAIIANQGAVETAYAAGLARAYSGGGYTDWFLPSKEELHQMYQNKAMINSTATANSGSNFTNYYYWSSTEVDLNNAWYQYFVNGNQFVYDKIYTGFVRAVRAF
jgi:hypothetical protein